MNKQRLTKFMYVFLLIIGISIGASTQYANASMKTFSGYDGTYAVDTSSLYVEKNDTLNDMPYKIWDVIVYKTDSGEQKTLKFVLKNGYEQIFVYPDGFEYDYNNIGYNTQCALIKIYLYTFKEAFGVYFS